MTFRWTSFPWTAVGAGASLLALAFALPNAGSADTIKIVPAPTLDEAGSTARSETAVLAGGCFWGVQGVFQHVTGVTSAVSGYSGGSKADATYPAVSTGTTGHAESVKVTYDPRAISYGQILRIYFSVVTDPTTLDAQGPDEGSQYRSDLFATSPEQAKIAKTYIAQLEASRVFTAPIVTKVSTLEAFYPAEEHHQNYLTDHPTAAYIARNDMPKVEGLKALFGPIYRATPVLVSGGID